MDTRQRLTWKKAATLSDLSENMRVASREVEAATGLYGYTKSVQGSVEVATRKLSKRALTLARMAYEKDEDVVGFLHAHATRGESRTAGVLLNAMKELGPKIPGKTASGRDPELRDYPVLAEIYESGRDWGIFLDDVRGLIKDGATTAKELDPALPPTPKGGWRAELWDEVESLLEEIQRHSKRASVKTGGLGLYGFKSKTAELGVRACGDLRLAAGEIASELHTRKGDMHPMITGYLQKHATKGKCGYAGMLYGCYPDAPPQAPAKPAAKQASTPVVAPPTTVAGWLRLRPTE